MPTLPNLYSPYTQYLTVQYTTLGAVGRLRTLRSQALGYATLKPPTIFFLSCGLRRGDRLYATLSGGPDGEMLGAVSCIDVVVNVVALRRILVGMRL